MLKSLFSGVSGLKVHNTRMDVIGNNIANVNTAGFKGSRVSFKDSFYQTLTASAEASATLGGGNAAQVGGGSLTATIDVLHTRSNFNPTGKGTNVYIDGEGFLIARDGEGKEMYTRVGDTEFDGKGNFVNGKLHYIVGYPIARDNTGNIIFQETKAEPAKVTLGGMKFNFHEDNGDAFNGYNISFVDTPGAALAATANATTKTITIAFDSTNAGNTAAALQTAIRGLTVTPGNITNLGGNTPGPKTLVAADFAKITVESLVAGATMVAGGPSVISGGVDKVSGIPKLDMEGGLQIIKKPGSLIDTDGDGVFDAENKEDVMELNNISVDKTGVIIGTFEGKVIPLGRIAIASVPNPSALVMEGNSYFKAENNTGKITYHAAGTGPVGGIQSSGMEMSNVDLADEFSNMIITQRGFQANSRIITVGDEMLQELVNLKR